MKAALTVSFLGVLLCYQPCSAQIQESFFGLHQNKYTKGEPWPTVPFAIRRSVSDIVSWSDLEGCPGGPDPNDPCYHWGTNLKGGNLDKVVNDSYAHGVDVMFTVYSVPGWASTRGSRCRGAGSPDRNCAGPADDECGSHKHKRLQVIGSCDPPYDVDAVVGSGEGDGSDKLFKDFVTAVATRYGKKIKYWEMWNEAPNIRFANPDHFTFKQFARMTKDFRDAVKRVNPDAIVLGANTCYCTPPGSAQFQSWTEGYFTALDKYGPSVVDAVSYHGYWHPEKIVELVRVLREIADKHPSTRGKPFYDTEDAWPGRLSLRTASGALDWDAQAAWFARSMILRAAEGTKAYIFFGWDLYPKVNMWSRDKIDACTIPNRDGQAGYLCPLASIYERARTWLLGAVFDKSCTAQRQAGGRVWSCDFTKSGGSYHGRFVWYDGRGDKATYTPERQYVIARNLDGSTSDLKTKGPLSLGQTPVLLETK